MRGDHWTYQPTMTDTNGGKEDSSEGNWNVVRKGEHILCGELIGTVYLTAFKEDK